MSTLDYRKPLPSPTLDSEPYYRYLREHDLRVQRCTACGRPWLPAGPVCPSCWSSAFTWTPVSGLGRVYSWTIVHEVYDKSFAEDVPYCLAMIELDEGPRLLTNLVGIEPGSIAAGLRVGVRYEDVTSEVTLVKFGPAPEPGRKT